MSVLSPSTTSPSMIRTSKSQVIGFCSSTHLRHRYHYVDPSKKRAPPGAYVDPVD